MITSQQVMRIHSIRNMGDARAVDTDDVTHAGLQVGVHQMVLAHVQVADTCQVQLLGELHPRTQRYLRPLTRQYEPCLEAEVEVFKHMVAWTSPRNTRGMTRPGWQLTDDRCQCVAALTLPIVGSKIDSTSEILCQPVLAVCFVPDSSHALITTHLEVLSNVDRPDALELQHL